jgi:hypothetical protein
VVIRCSHGCPALGCRTAEGGAHLVEGLVLVRFVDAAVQLGNLGPRQILRRGDGCFAALARGVPTQHKLLPRRQVGKQILDRPFASHTRQGELLRRQLGNLGFKFGQFGIHGRQQVGLCFRAWHGSSWVLNPVRIWALQRKQACVLLWSGAAQACRQSTLLRLHCGPRPVAGAVRGRLNRGAHRTPDQPGPG